MIRDIPHIARHTFDVIIIGGGIHGAATAWQCALHGLRTAIIEKTDFGCETSANSLKIIHGGFRYLQHLNIKRMRESIISRRIMSQLSPENVRALRCAIPNTGFGLRSKYLMRIALLLNDLIAFDRNRNVPTECSIPRGKILSLRQCREMFPAIDWQGKSGGSIWYDALALNSERLTLAFVQEAVKNGATAANYLELKEIIHSKGSITGIKAWDRIDHQEIEIQARSLVVAAGASNDKLLGILQRRGDRQEKWAKAVNVIVKRKLLKDTAIGVTGESDFSDSDAIIKKKGRFFFFVPWREFTMIGTTYNFDPNTEAVQADLSDIKDILNEVNTIFPAAELTVDMVSKAHAGIVPAYSSQNKDDEVQLVKETSITDLSQQLLHPVEGLFAVKSVKYTTAPIVAMQAAEKVATYLNKPFKDTATDIFLLQKQTVLSASNNSAHAQKIRMRYGQRSPIVMRYLAADEELMSDRPYLVGGEVDYFIHEEMAFTLSDIVLRRSEVGTAECPPYEVLKKIANKMADHYGWGSVQIAAEIDNVQAAFNWQ